MAKTRRVTTRAGQDGAEQPEPTPVALDLAAIAAAMKVLRKQVDKAPTGINNNTCEARAGALAVRKAVYDLRRLLRPSYPEDGGDYNPALYDLDLPPKTVQVLKTVWGATARDLYRNISPYRNDNVDMFDPSRRLPLTYDDRVSWLVMLDESLVVLGERSEQSRDGTGRQEHPTCDHEDLSILRALDKTWPRLQTQYDLEAESGVSRRTISKRLPNLEICGWVTRPRGKRSGATITSAGRTFLQTIDPLKSAH